MPDAKSSGVQIDVGPQEPEKLALSQASGKGQTIKGVESIRFRMLKDLIDFGPGEGENRFTLR